MNMPKGEENEMLEFLTDNLRSALRSVNINLVYELRVRANKPVVINYGGRYTFLGACGVTEYREGALTATYADIEGILYRASEYSIYSVTDQLRQGFITGSCGERIGLAGIFVYENGKQFTVKEVTSINIRVPHEVIGCGEFIYERCLARELASVLILSAPGRGKTTILRDIARLLCSNRLLNVLINDERNEISGAYRDFSLDTGAFSDVIRYSDKRDAFAAAVRSMRPDVIVTDELVTESEIRAAAACARGGVEVIASAHCKDVQSLRDFNVLSAAVEEKVFSYYVFLQADGLGKVAAIYDRQFHAVYEV